MQIRTRTAGAALGSIFAATCAFAAAPATPSPADLQRRMQVVAEALKEVGPVKQAVQSYRLSHEDFPASNAEARLLGPLAFASNSVRTITIGAEGVVDVSLTSASGVDGGIIRFRPDYAPQSGGGDVHWTCASASYADIADLTGGLCEHTTQP
jgi:hypothetical protein